MKASKLNDGFWFISYATTEKGQELKSIPIKKIGNQLNYFGTDYWDDARKIEGEFKPMKIKDEPIK